VCTPLLSQEASFSFEDSRTGLEGYAPCVTMTPPGATHYDCKAATSPDPHERSLPCRESDQKKISPLSSHLHSPPSHVCPLASASRSHPRGTGPKIRELPVLAHLSRIHVVSVHTRLFGTTRGVAQRVEAQRDVNVAQGVMRRPDTSKVFHP
jgi:hypothetical protein